jgi:ATP-dependent exoDNAse (exonuclease V) beta subunit
MLEEHFESVQGLVHSPLQQPSIIAGQMSGIRKRVYKRLRSNLDNASLELEEAIEAIHSKPLTAEAEGRLRKALNARSDEELGSLITTMHSDNRLVIEDEPGQDPIRIVCSMGVSKNGK